MNSKGFSLVEVILAVALFSVIAMFTLEILQANQVLLARANNYSKFEIEMQKLSARIRYDDTDLNEDRAARNNKLSEYIIRTEDALNDLKQGGGVYGGGVYSGNDEYSISVDDDLSVDIIMAIIPNAINQPTSKILSTDYGYTMKNTKYTITATGPMATIKKEILKGESFIADEAGDETDE